MSAAAPAEPDAEPAPPSRSKPVVVIDAGHGGIDPGALGADNVLEKSIALAVAQQLRLALAASGRYELVMTRTGDVFVLLGKRLDLAAPRRRPLPLDPRRFHRVQGARAGHSRRHRLHALERASDEQARIMAEKENASDLLAGIDRGETGTKDEVRSISSIC